jgi:AcrR family transcriptional regulator
MTHSALYWHFSSKEEILYQYLLAYGGQGYEAVQVAAQSGPPEQRLWRFVRAFAQYHIDLPDFELGWGILARHGRLGEHLPDDQRQEFVESDQRLIAYVEEILVEGMKAGVFRKLDVRLTTNVILNMCHSPLGAWFLLSGPADPAIVPATYADLALHMVAAEPGIVGRSRDGHSEAVAE